MRRSWFRSLVRRCSAVACAAGLLAGDIGAAAAPPAMEVQDIEVPVDVQLAILLKVMTFDRKLAVRAPRAVAIGVAYQGGNRASVVAKDEALRVLRATEQLADGVALRAVAIDLDATTLAEADAKEGLTHLFVAPLRAFDVKEIVGWARRAGVTTMSSVSRHVRDGLALGVGLRGGRPRILVNVESSRLEGADLSAELLKLAEIVK